MVSQGTWVAHPLKWSHCDPHPTSWNQMVSCELFTEGSCEWLLSYVAKEGRCGRWFRNIGCTLHITNHHSMMPACGCWCKKSCVRIHPGYKKNLPTVGLTFDYSTQTGAGFPSTVSLRRVVSVSPIHQYIPSWPSEGRFMVGIFVWPKCVSWWSPLP